MTFFFLLASQSKENSIEVYLRIQCSILHKEPQGFSKNWTAKRD